MTEAWVIDESPNSLRRLDNEMRGSLRKLNRTPAEIESVVSRTWIAAGRTFRGECTLRDFLRIVLRRKLSDYDRAAKCRPWFGANRTDYLPPDDLPNGENSAESELFEAATMDRVQSKLAEIPAHYAEVVELVLRGYSNFAIADKLGIKYHTVRSRYSRGKTLLIELLACDDENSGADDDD